MKIASIHLQNFKRFTDLRIQNIPATAKLVILLGHNGCGKSSVFDALQCKSYKYRQSRHDENPDYYLEISTQEQRLNQIDIEFHNSSLPDMEKAIYVRTAYRTMTENDAAAADNHQRLVSNLVGLIFGRENFSKTLRQFQDEAIAEIQDAMRRLFPDLVLSGLGNPLSGRNFTFAKGANSNLLYQNLSGGEKSAFDLLLDIFVKREEYADTVFCIDEPDMHMGARLQGALLEELFGLMNDKSQLWIATHAIGMMRTALQLYEQHGEKVVFLDFDDNRDNRDFDSQEVVIMKPEKPGREFWERTHEVALDDLAALVMPDQIVICEGSHGDKGFDAECYNQIFSEEFPNTKFISAGGKGGLHNYIPVIGAIAEGAKVFGLRDRDQATIGEVSDLKQEGIQVLEQGQIEDYLLADDVLHALCQGNEHCTGKADDLIGLRNSTSNIKEAAEKIRQKVIVWGMSGAGETRGGFLRDTIASLIKPGMPTYEKLKQIVFE